MMAYVYDKKLIILAGVHDSTKEKHVMTNARRAIMAQGMRCVHVFAALTSFYRLETVGRAIQCSRRYSPPSNITSSTNNSACHDTIGILSKHVH